MQPIWRLRWRGNRFAWMLPRIRRWCEILPANWAGCLPRNRAPQNPAMRRGRAANNVASVASTYARAFADVVLGAKLDVNRAIAELLAMAALRAENSQLRGLWGNPAIPAGQKRKVVGGDGARGWVLKKEV